jgi:hypothetical protein
VTAAGPCLLVVGAALMLCASGVGGGETMSGRPIDEVLKAHARELLSLPGVVGAARGVCADQPCIKVFVEKLHDDLRQSIPAAIEGYPVAVEETGTIRALPVGE